MAQSAIVVLDPASHHLRLSMFLLNRPLTRSNSQVLLPALTAFVQLVLEGRTPTFIRPYFFGANLTAIRKSDGGVKPIAVGCSLRRLAPRQLDYGVGGGSETAVHAARIYLRDLGTGNAVLKLYFRNALKPFTGTRCCPRFWNMPPVSTLSSIQHILHHHYSS